MSLPRFLVLELLAVVVLIVSLRAGVQTRFETGELALIWHILPIISAAAGIALAIVFFCQPRPAVRAVDPD